jgi:hypothetical protein
VVESSQARAASWFVLRFGAAEADDGEAAGVAGVECGDLGDPADRRDESPLAEGLALR